MASTLTVDKIKGGSSGVALTLPTTDGSAGQLLKTNGSAVLSWATDVDTGITDVVDDTTPQLGGDLDCNGAQIQWSKGADVASATALPVLTDGNYFDVTGTTTVTSINTTGGAGTLIKLHFDAILILTHHATDLILPGGANITTAAGDEAEFIEYATGDYRCTNYSKADGTSVVGGLDDNSVTLAKMAGGTDGNLITYDASGDPAYVTTGTSGQVLTSGGVGVAPTFQTAAGGGATSINGLSDGTTSGTNNTGLGSTALDSLTSGINNTAVGTDALTYINSGNDNVASGYRAGYSLTTGSRNVAIGKQALYVGTVNDNVVAIGSGAGYGHSGSECVAIGRDAMYASSSSVNCVAVGKDALKNNTTNNQVAVGYQACTSATIGYYLTGVGSGALNSTTTGHNCAGIGRAAVSSTATAHNEFTLGDGSVSNLRCADTSISSLSDQRDKAEIIDLPDSAGLDLINALRPVTYYWDKREWYDDGVSDGSKIKRDYRSWKAQSGLKQGFIAQEVEAAISGEKCLEDSMIVTGTEDKKEFAPAHLLTNAIKAIQQLSAEMEILKSEVATLKGV